jgi:predicted transcriptional regulator
MTKRRSRMDIIHSILRTIKGYRVGAYKTQILYRSNLSHSLLNRYLDFVMENELVETKKTDMKSAYYITEKGEEFIKTYEQMRRTFSSTV